MNENLDLVELLKDCPQGTKLYSTVYGEVELTTVRGYSFEYPVNFSAGSVIGCVSKEGRIVNKFKGECTLFPSRDQRDWSKFEIPNVYVDTDDSNKNEVKYRPFKNIEECFEEMKKHSPFGWICNVNDGYNLIVFLNDEDIRFDGSCVSYQEAFKRGYTFMDGLPFGIKDE